MPEIMFPLENTDYSAADAQLWFATRLSGVYTNGHLAVSAPGGMAVSVGKGIAWMNYGEFAGAVYGNTSEKTLVISLADANYPRIDRVAVRYDAIQNTGALTIIAGTPASSPAAPAITRNENYYEISLAQIYVSPGATEINAADITDERMNEAVCGLMRDGVTGIDTSVIHAKAMAMLENIDQAYQAAISGTLAGELQLRLDALEEYPKIGRRNVQPSIFSDDDTTAPFRFGFGVNGVGENDLIEVRIDYDNPNMTDDKDTYREAMRNAMISPDAINANADGSYTIWLVCDGEFPKSLTNMYFLIINHGPGVIW